MHHADVLGWHKGLEECLSADWSIASSRVLCDPCPADSRGKQGSQIQLLHARSAEIG